MNIDTLTSIFVFLAAICIAVPLSSRYRLGAVLGYLIAGVLIGPYVLRLIGNAEEVMHFAEFGVVMMLFLIGLELEPATLWRLRKTIIGLGGLQVGLTTAVFTALGMTFGFTFAASFSVGSALSLSSTALVMQMLEERQLTSTSVGLSAFSVLLLQDIAVIPILIILPLLANGSGTLAPQGADWFVTLPGFARAGLITAVIAVMILGGGALQYLFRFIARAGVPEVFTALSLALVIGITVLMLMMGVSPALGAFIAGLVLANSDYKQALETDLKPFKGLLLGLFFISVGMGMNLDLFLRFPLQLASAVCAVMIVKALILALLGRRFDLTPVQNIGLAVALAQSGEFAFVLFQYAGGLNLLVPEAITFLNLTVALSMALTPILIALYARYGVPRFLSRVPQRDYDAVTANGDGVIIAGYGRFGQIIGRFLKAQGIDPIILEIDPDQIATLRRFGSPGFFGDASRLDLLRNAGAAKARILVIAVDDADKAIEIAQMARHEFPGLKVYARARNRRHAYDLFKSGVASFRRETFDSSLTMAQQIMVALGHSAEDMARNAALFMRHDEETLLKSFDFFEREQELVDFSKQATGELENILHSDQSDRHAPVEKKRA